MLQRAGEGGGALPKGLSLFRFVLFSCVMLGGVYGAASLYFNALPFPGDVPPAGVASAQWQPSALWLPSFALIKLNVNVLHTPDGYRFSSQLGHAAFASLSIFIGMAMGFALGWIIGEKIRKHHVANRNL